MATRWRKTVTKLHESTIRSLQRRVFQIIEIIQSLNMSSLTQIKTKWDFALIVVNLDISQEIVETDRRAQIVEEQDIELPTAETCQGERIFNAILVTALKNLKKEIIEQSIPQIIRKTKT